jgi:aminoglycoside phosphotransferase (APT) family kinase protein
MTTAEQALDLPRLTAWLDRTMPGPAQPTQVRLISGGSSNLMFRLVRGDQHYALRTPPLTLNDRTSDTLVREILLLRALGQTAVPHARLVLADENGDEAGRRCAVMEWVEGFQPNGAMGPPFRDDPQTRREMGFEMVRALAKLATIDWQAVGLATFGKPEGFLERQVDRWMSQLDRYRSRDLPHLEEIVTWLRDNRPHSYETGFMHGDFQFFNVLFRNEPPARLAAVLDWETATIGDPMLDLGHLLASWREKGEEPGFLNDMNDWAGFPTRREMADAYADLTGRSVAHANYYIVLALFRLAIILEGHYYRYASGASDHPNHQRCEAKVPMMFRQAVSFAEAA